MTCQRTCDTVPASDVSASPGRAAAPGAHARRAPSHFETLGPPLDADGRVLDGVFSSGPIGRLFADGAIERVAYLHSKA
jgi:hypothetical protein